MGHKFLITQPHGCAAEFRPLTWPECSQQPSPRAFWPGKPLCTPDPGRLYISAGASWRAREHGLYRFLLDLVTRDWGWDPAPASPLSCSATFCNALNHFSMLQTGWAPQTGHVFSKGGHFLHAVDLMESWRLKLRWLWEIPGGECEVEESDGTEQVVCAHGSSWAAIVHQAVVVAYKVLSHTSSHFILTTILGSSTVHVL